jgi:hypothetical protein
LLKPLFLISVENGGITVRFQETSKMKGGDEFIMRFLNPEAARLGHTVESYIGPCPDIIEKYKGYMELIGFKE